jgi:hypothetical protein
MTRSSKASAEEARGHKRPHFKHLIIGLKWGRANVITADALNNLKFLS